MQASRRLVADVRDPNFLEFTQNWPTIWAGFRITWRTIAFVHHRIADNLFFSKTELPGFIDVDIASPKRSLFFLTVYTAICLFDENFSSNNEYLVHLFLRLLVKRCDVMFRWQIKRETRNNKNTSYTFFHFFFDSANFTDHRTCVRMFEACAKSAIVTVHFAS